MANVLLRDESKFDVSEQPLDFWPVRTLMAPADECEYTYHELIKVLNGETSRKIMQVYPVHTNCWQTMFRLLRIPFLDTKRQTALYRRFQH